MKKIKNYFVIYYKDRNIAKFITNLFNSTYMFEQDIQFLSEYDVFDDFDDEIEINEIRFYIKDELDNDFMGDQYNSGAVSFFVPNNILYQIKNDIEEEIRALRGLGLSARSHDAIQFLWWSDKLIEFENFIESHYFKFIADFNTFGDFQKPDNFLKQNKQQILDSLKNSSNTLPIILLDQHYGITDEYFFEKQSMLTNFDNKTKEILGDVIVRKPINYFNHIYPKYFYTIYDVFLNVINFVFKQNNDNEYNECIDIVHEDMKDLYDRKSYDFRIKTQLRRRVATWS